MEIHSLASGSSGNAYIIKNGNFSILLDAGLSGKRTLAGLTSVGIDPATIKAILITHEHSDHIAGAGIISRRLNLPIFMTSGTWKGSAARIGNVPAENIHIIKPLDPFSLGDIEITAMNISHDAGDPVNFVFDNGKQRAVVLTDTGCVTAEMLKVLATCQAMVLEANHDPEMLQTGPYPWPLKQRVAGNRGHLSNLQAARVAAWLIINGKIQRIHLGHLSAVNNNPQCALASVAQHLAQEGLSSEPAYRYLQVLPRHHAGPVLQVK